MPSLLLLVKPDDGPECKAMDAEACEAALSPVSVAMDDLDGITGAAAGLRARVTAAPLPAEVAAEVASACTALGAGPVAVRSSATLEDSAEASFAGLQDTYLAVRGAGAVLDRVRACWASLYNDESIAYRRRQGTGEDGLAMGVVVQPMLDPRSAGVMFTRSPVTGDRSVVAIEGTWGLGSALVGGEVTPDSFTVSKVTGEITGRRVSVKLRAHSFTPNGQGISAAPMPWIDKGRTTCTLLEGNPPDGGICRSPNGACLRALPRRS